MKKTSLLLLVVTAFVGSAMATTPTTSTQKAMVQKTPAQKTVAVTVPFQLRPNLSLIPPSQRFNC